MDLTQWQNDAVASPIALAGKRGWKLSPQTASQVAILLQEAQTHQQKLAFNATDAAQLDLPLYLDLSGLKQVRQYPTEDFMIEVETGITIGELAAITAQKQQQFPLSYPPETLLADVLSEDRPALETGIAGYPRDYVLKTEIATPNGQLTISGADVVKNVTGYDLAKLYVGSHHSFGVLTSVTLKLTALPAQHEHWLLDLNSDNQAYTLSRELPNSSLPVRMAALIPHGKAWQILVELAGDPSLLAECPNVLAPLASQPPKKLSPTEAQLLIESLQRIQSGPNTIQTIIEVALPFGRWPLWVDAIRHKAAFEHVDLKIRPLAGLIYISADEFSTSQLWELQAETAKHEGFFQIIQMPNADPTFIAKYNLPQDATTLRLLKALKNSYDPKGILWNSRFPLLVDNVRDETTEAAASPA